MDENNYNEFSEPIPRDMPECNVTIRDESGNILTRWNIDYWEYWDMLNSKFYAKE